MHKSTIKNNPGSLATKGLFFIMSKSYKYDSSAITMLHCKSPMLVHEFLQ